MTNDLLIVPDGEVSEGTEKINLKYLYKTFKDTKFHGLVSIQFLYVLGKFLGLIFPYLKMPSQSCIKTFRTKL